MAVAKAGEMALKKSDNTAQGRHDPSGMDDMEQVRQLLLGDQQAEQERQILALEERIAQLERLVDGLIAHGEASRKAWQNEVAGLASDRSRQSGHRAISQQVTPLTPRNREPNDGKDD